MTSRISSSFPLDRRGRLAADVINNTRYAAQLVDYPVRYLADEFVRQVRPVRRHEVDRLDRAQRDHPLVRTRIADDADRFHRQEHGERLTDVVVQAVRAQLADEDV